MIKWLIAICLIFNSWIVQAHQADISSTMLVEQANGNWVLQVRAALIAFEYEINTHFGEDAYPTPEKFQELVITHLKENIAIQFDDKNTVVFKNAQVKLGHETNAIFEVIGVPETYHSISVKNSSFRDIRRNQSALMVLKKGFAKEQFILNEENGHAATLLAKDSKFVLLSASGKGTTAWSLSYLIPVIIGLGIVVFFIKKRII